MRKRLHDNGFGKKTLTETGIHYDLPICTLKELTSSSSGLFEGYVDASGVKHKNMGSVIGPAKVAWKYTNETIDDVGAGTVVILKTGNDSSTGAYWDNMKTYSHNDKSEHVVNRGSD